MQVSAQSQHVKGVETEGQSPALPWTSGVILEKPVLFLHCDFAESAGVLEVALPRKGGEVGFLPGVRLIPADLVV